MYKLMKHNLLFKNGGVFMKEKETRDIPSVLQKIRDEIRNKTDKEKPTWDKDSWDKGEPWDKGHWANRK